MVIMIVTRKHLGHTETSKLKTVTDLLTDYGLLVLELLPQQKIIHMNILDKAPAGWRYLWCLLTSSLILTVCATCRNSLLPPPSPDKAELD